MDAIDGSEPSMDSIDYAISMATKQGEVEHMVMTVVRMAVCSYGLRGRLLIPNCRWRQQ
ncbi:MAG TPA: hypothetical protein VFS97_15385 [Nitrososphaeraceae archaeon]|nr:hypothetical protein [Nitrososphaeraceae archaeon]